MRAQQIADRIWLVIVLAIGVTLGAHIGDISEALTALAIGIAFSETFDLVHRWGRDAWPVIKDWWTR